MQQKEASDWIELIISSDDLAKHKRLDTFLSEKIPHLSRSFIKQLFQKDLISTTSELIKKIELKKMPPEGTVILVEVPPPLPDKAQPEDIPLEILYEDNDLLIVNKEAGMVTHPAPGNWTGTLVNAVLFHCEDLKGMGDTKRPGIVHRLDKGTSGIMVVAKNRKCHEGLVLLFSTHDIIRKYQCLAMGKEFNQGGTLKSMIGRHPQNRLKMSTKARVGKNAITHYKLLEQFGSLGHFEMTLETGRTHQIRVHLTELLKAPILCDPLYGNPKQDLTRVSEECQGIIGDYPYPFLHARVLGFKHPITGQDLYFEAPPPKIFQDLLKQLSLENSHEPH